MKALSGEVVIRVTDGAAAQFGDRAKTTDIPGIYRLSVPEGDLAQAAESVKQLPGVLGANPNYVATKALSPNDNLFAGYQWNMPRIAAPNAWNQTTGHSNMVLASLDTGVNFNHEDLVTKKWTNGGEIAGNAIDDDNNGYVDDRDGFDFVNGTLNGSIYTNDANGPVDDDGHGSLTSGVMAAASNNSVGVAGVNWQAKIMAIKVLDTEGYGSFTDVAAGIRYAAKNGARVVNVSLGANCGCSDVATNAAIQYANGLGTVVVAASGNDGDDTSIDYPASDAGAIAVGSTDSNDNRSGFSNGANGLSVVAPGASIATPNAVMSPPNPASVSVASGSGTLTTGNYRYFVTAINANGETWAVTPSTNPNQNLATITAGQVANVNWNSVYGATGYKIYRTPVNGAADSEKLLATLGTETNYTDNGSATLGSTSPPSVNGATMNTSYASASGTSLATPHVTGLAGLLLGVKPSLTPAQVKGAIENSADKPSGMAGQHYTTGFGYGRINVHRALSSFPAYGAAYVRQSSVAPLGSGEQTTISVDFQNTGSQTWVNSGDNAVKLGTSRPRDRQSVFHHNSWLSQNRAATFANKVDADGNPTPSSVINPGEVARFSFTIVAPPVGGTLNLREYFQPVIEGVTWLDDWGQYWDITANPQSYVYSHVGQTQPPALMQPGQRVSLSLDLRNDGTATWRRDAFNRFRIGTSHPLDRPSRFVNNTWIHPTRLGEFAGKVSGGLLTNSDTIAPGETARFDFDFVAPSTGGVYREYFRPLVERAAWLNDIGIYFETTVPFADYDYQHVGQTNPPAVMDRNQQATVKLDLRNIGKQTWDNTGSAQMRLGTERPRDGGSILCSTPSWLSCNRIKLTRNLTDASKNNGGNTTVGPGEVGQWEFILQAPSVGGQYDQYFTPVIDGTTWMRDIGIFFPVYVKQPINVGISQQSSATVVSNGPVNIKNDSGQVVGTAAAGQQVTISAGGSTTRVEQQNPAAAFTVTNLAENGNYNVFRGNLQVRNGAPGTWLINDVNLEDYLKGGGEVPDGWPIEAVKAQTVAARTYAARKINAPSTSLFNLYDDTRDQVYNGYNAEAVKPNTSVAVNQTAGKVLYYGGQLIQAFYSSDSGGATESNENVWGSSPIAYLRGRTDPYQRPDVWAKTVGNATLQSNFGVPGNIDAIYGVEAYPSGRLKTVTFVTTGGAQHTRTYTADTMRSKFTTKSSLITGLGRSGNDWVIHGRGFGHGLGMAQWGAYNQALQGQNFTGILQYYYTGVSVGNL